MQISLCNPLLFSRSAVKLQSFSTKSSKLAMSAIRYDLSFLLQTPDPGGFGGIAIWLGVLGSSTSLLANS